MSASRRRPPWREFHQALRAEGFHPSRSLGQNFLLDSNLARAIVRDARVGRGAFVLEVGTGCGFLSHELALAGVRLVTVEIDARLARLARRWLAPFPEVSVIEGDVLASKHALAANILAALPASGDWHVVANLPYGVAGPVLGCLARIPAPPTSLTVLVQLEVARRLVSHPGERAWGALTAKLAALYDASLLRRVGPELFWPRPRVSSALVRLERRDVAPVGDLAAFDALVEGLFRHRRKGLARGLAGLLGDRAAARALLEEARIAPERRPGELTLEELARLAAARRWRKGSPGGSLEP